MKTLFYSLILILSLSLPAHADEISDAALQDKIDQLFIVVFRGTSFENTDARTILSDTNVGGVILFDYDTPTKKYDRNIKTKVQTQRLIVDLQTQAKTKLFISIFWTNHYSSN